MAIFSSNVSQLKTADVSGLKNIDIPEFDFRGKACEGDFMSHLDKMTEAMRAKQSQQRTDLKLDELDFGSALAEAGFEHTESTLDRLLRQAKELIADAQYGAAAGPLSEILSISPTHHEALYLFAYCRAQMGDYESALRTLQRLRHARVNDPLQTRITALKAEIRDRMLFGVVLENYLLLQTGRYDLAIGRLQYAVELDPEVGIYHYMLAGSLMQSGHFEQARAAVNNGLNECGNDQRAMLLGFKSAIERNYVARQMEPAREKFKHGQYGRARRLLNQISPAYRQVPLYVTFAMYVDRLAGDGLLSYFRRGEAPTFGPEGKAKDVEDLCFFLIQEELDTARPLLHDGRYDLAEEVLEHAVACTPNFPYVHYLYAGCIYSRLTEQLSGDNPPDLDKTSADMDRAQRCAQIGVTDKEITDAQALLAAIKTANHQLQEIVGERQKRKSEIALVNGIISEFQAIMDLAKDGISSPAQHRNINGQMRSLKARLSDTRAQIHSDDAKDALGQVADAIERNLKQLQGLGAELKESEEVHGCYERFNRKMEALKTHGIRSIADFTDTQTFFSDLKRDAQQIKKRLQQPGAISAIDDLIATIDQVLNQMAVR